MYCRIEPAAREKLSVKIKKNPNHFLKLIYDTVGCGCVNDGVIYLALVKKIDQQHDMRIDSADWPIYIERQYEVYYDNQLQITYQSKFQCFQLKSPNQYINPRMRFVIEQN